jgi:hypothetical protein
VAGDGDWRLLGQEDFLTGRQLRWLDWRPYREGWEHDHCSFCQREFAVPGSDHADFSAGYVTADDNYYWICADCFRDFSERFAWTLATG